ncbi:hypothetical protein RRG08_050802 [Elysia crispata]|uniref:N-acetyltransferase domain-containing protein n=1 Tax=Elysia crispata TaxID=231223 RepID=A0AAE1CYF7_9GAST|nr:hypothetical protein RRG08_050802 [Elysia crispata]
MAAEQQNRQQTYVVRKAEPQDSNQIYSCVEALASFHMSELDPGRSPESFLKEVFGEDTICQVLVATTKTDRSTIVGYGLFYRAYSTWTGPALYLEDLYVTPAHRGKGVGKLIWQNIVQIGFETGCKGVRMTVHMWNKQAKNMWEGLGCVDLSEKRHEHFLFYTIQGKRSIIETAFQTEFEG